MSLLTNFQDLVRTLNHVLAKKADKTDVSSVESKVDSLSTVAQTGSYNDLNNKPTLSVVAGTGEYSDLLNKPSLASVATSGDYYDLSNTPTIPAAQIQSDWNQSSSSSLDYIKNKPNLATVATSGSYNDLSNQPTIPTAGTISNGSQGYARGGDVYTALQTKQDTLPTSGASSGDVLYWTGSQWSTMAPPSGFVAQSTAPADTSALWIDIDDDTIEGFVDGNNMDF